MTKRAFDKIKAGLDSAKAYLDGTADKRKYRVHIPEKINVRRIRTRLGLSQEAFARILLKIVEREPEAVTRTLAS